MKLIKDNEAFLRATTVAHTEQGRALIATAKKSQLDALCELLLNIIRGIIPLPEDTLRKAVRYKRVLRQLVSKVLKKTLRKELLIKYFNIIKKLLSIALPVIGLIVTGSELAGT